MAELIRLGRTTVDVSKMVAFFEEDGEKVTLLFDGTSTLAIEGTEAARFLRYLAPRIVDAATHSPSIAAEAEDPEARPRGARKKAP